MNIIEFFENLDGDRIPGYDSSIFVVLGIAVGLLVVLAFVRITRRSEPIGHWHLTYATMQASPLHFYSLLDAKDSMHSIPILTNRGKVLRRTGGWFSKRRKYYKLSTRQMVIEICASPIGDNFFFSYWVFERISLTTAILLRIPILGLYIHRRRHKIHPYKRDYIQATSDVIHKAVLEVVQEVTSGSNLDPVRKGSEAPVMQNVFTR